MNLEGATAAKKRAPQTPTEAAHVRLRGSCSKAGSGGIEWVKLGTGIKEGNDGLVLLCFGKRETRTRGVLGMRQKMPKGWKASGKTQGREEPS